MGESVVTTVDYGDPRLPDRFWDKVFPEPMSGCWLWAGATDAGGYGISWDGTRRIQAHRWVCSVNLGEPPQGHNTRHTCDVRACVNPDHLVWGTPRENTQDMMRRNRHSYASRSHCANGHPFTVENTRLRAGGGRICRACDANRAQCRRDFLVSQGLNTLGQPRKRQV